MKLAIKELKAVAECTSQGLEIRRSVLPLLISFLFSHIVSCIRPDRPNGPHSAFSLFFLSSSHLYSFFLIPFYPFHIGTLSRVVLIHACNSHSQKGSSSSSSSLFYSFSFLSWRDRKISIPGLLEAVRLVGNTYQQEFHVEHS